MNNKKLIYCLRSDSHVGARAHWVLQRNYQVESFQDQESFIEALTQIEPDLVILDTWNKVRKPPMYSYGECLLSFER